MDYQDREKMYGFVNQAIREFVIQNHGEDAWGEIKKEAQVKHECFLPDRTYPDTVTYSLVGTIAKKCGISIAQALEVFGEFWVSFVDDRGYGALLSGNGKTFKEFLSNLDQFHSRLSTAYPEFNPPEFEFYDRGENVELIYQSQRSGLAPIVSGILRGLAKRYGTEIELVADCQECSATFVITEIERAEVS